MAQKKNNGGKKKTTRSRIAPRKGGTMDARVAHHVGMLVDPCNSVLAPTAYRGKDGFITRFSSVEGVGGSTSTAAVIAFWPKYNRIYRLNMDNTATNFSIDFYTGGPGISILGPGHPFLGANASEVRPVAACMTSLYSGAELERSGLVVRGVVPYKSVSGTLNVEQLCNLLQQWDRTPSNVSETKWIPSPDDENYIATPSSQPSVVEDSNIVVVVFRGYTPGHINTAVRFTTIYEWQPFYGLGIQSPTPNTPDSPAGMERVRSALHGLGHWWLDFKSTVGTAARVARMITRDVTPLVGAARALPLLTAA